MPVPSVVSEIVVMHWGLNDSVSALNDFVCDAFFYKTMLRLQGYTCFV